MAVLAEKRTRAKAAPPGTLYEVDDARRSLFESMVESSPARKAIILAYKADPPLTTNVAVSLARHLSRTGVGATDLSVRALKRADAQLKRIGVVRPWTPP